jgi:hypothetical protein
MVGRWFCWSVKLRSVYNRCTNIAPSFSFTFLWVKEKIVFYSFPSQNVWSGSFLNLGPRTIFFALKLNISPACAIDQVINILNTEKIQTMIKVERNDYNSIIPALVNSPILEERVRQSSNWFFIYNDQAFLVKQTLNLFNGVFIIWLQLEEFVPIGGVKHTISFFNEALHLYVVPLGH